MQRPWLILLVALTFLFGCQSTPPTEQKVTVVYPEYQEETTTQQEEPVTVAKEEHYEPEIEEVPVVEKKETPKEKQKTSVVKKIEKKKVVEKVEQKKVVHKETPKEETKKETVAAKEVKEEKKIAAKPKKKQYRLRVISLPYHDYYHKEAKNIAEYFREKEGMQETKVHMSSSKTSKFWVVDIGVFKSSSTDSAKEFQKKIRTLKYQGVFQFQDAYYVSF